MADRSGSKHRRGYTAKSKLKYLEVFDAIINDDAILRKVEAFEAAPSAMGTPYTTALKWAKPQERARISKAASKEHAATLLRIDKSSRKVGAYPDVEREVFAKFKERRAKGRKVSGRWLTATARQAAARLHPGVNLPAGKSWRRRFSMRFNIGVRRKTNVKNI